MPTNDHLMRVEPVHASIGKFFEHKPMYRVPKYQRGYAWEDKEIDYFLSDIDKCFNSRKQGSPINHFFGGIVSIISSVPGVVSQNEYELVDGQQRMATLILLIANIIKLYKELLKETTESNDENNKHIIEKRIKELQVRFIEFEQEVNRNSHVVEVFVLSKADSQFFKDLIRQSTPTPIRESHDKLNTGYIKIGNKVKTLMGIGSIEDKLDNLETLKQLVDGDLSILHIKTFNKKEAFTLFSVLNNRGKSLTEGDLLRSKVLELLEGYPNQSSSVEMMWDDMLADNSTTTNNYLKYIYTSYAGRRPSANNLYDEFLGYFFPQNSLATISAFDADKIHDTMYFLRTGIHHCRKLADGECPIEHSFPITTWHANRLALLVKELRLTVTMPLLLSACQLDLKRFYEIVQILERFMFRFKVIGNQRMDSAEKIIFQHAKNIRLNSNYKINNLESELHSLQLAKVPDSQFKSLLENIKYSESGGNQSIKYFLITVEYYLRWYNEGHQGHPKCLDPSIIYDFSSTTIEHIYPRNAKVLDIDLLLEPLQNSLGNLTIMGPGDNQLGGNKNFTDKKNLFEISSVQLNKKTGENSKWTEVEVKDRVEELKNIACCIFNI